MTVVFNGMWIEIIGMFLSLMLCILSLEMYVYEPEPNNYDDIGKILFGLFLSFLISHLISIGLIVIGG